MKLTLNFFTREMCHRRGSQRFALVSVNNKQQELHKKLVFFCQMYTKKDVVQSTPIIIIDIKTVIFEICRKDNLRVLSETKYIVPLFCNIDCL